MKTLFTSLFSLLLSFTAGAQNLTKLSYVDLDSLIYLQYNLGKYADAIPYALAGLEKAKKEFGAKDSVYADFLSWGGFLYSEIRDFEKAEKLLKEAIEVQSKLRGKKHPAYVNEVNNLASMYHRMGDYPKAATLYTEAITIEKSISGGVNSDYAISLNNLAYLYNEMGDYEQAEPLYLEAVAVFSNLSDKENPDYAMSLNFLARLYFDMGNFSEAEMLFIEAATIQKKVFGTDHPNYATTQSNLASLYISQNNFAAAESHFLEAKAIQEKILGKLHPDYATTLHNLAILYAALKNYPFALKYYEEGLSIRGKALGKLHPHYAQSLNKFAAFNMEIGDYKRAEKQLLETKSIREISLGKEHPGYAHSLVNLAELYKNTGDYAAAWLNFEEAVNILSGLQNGPGINEIRADSILNAQYASGKHFEHLIYALGIAYELLALEPGKKKEQVIVANLAIQLLKKSRGKFVNEQDKLRMLSESHEWMLRSLQVLDLENQSDRAFEVSEFNKATLLLETVKSQQSHEMGDLSKSLLEEGKKLYKYYAQLEAALLEKRSKGARDSLVALLNNTGKEINVYKKKIETECPKYAALNFNPFDSKFEYIQKLLDDNSALLEYVIGDSIIYIFYLDKHQLRVSKSVVSTDLLKRNIHTLHKVLSDYEQIVAEPEKSRQDFCTTAFWFYENLLKSALRDVKDIDHLIIIPDGELAHLPFETFLVEQPGSNTGYSDFHYVLNDFKISYNYSATLWKENMGAVRNKNNGQMLAMAANYTGDEVDSLRSVSRLPTHNRLRQILQALPAAREEVEELQKVFSGFFGFDEEASERVFKQKAGEYAIIHLAMHGLLNERHPILSSLAFTEDRDSAENNFLQAFEISKLELKADLVVLSACETGFGKFEQGNGTASLARAFMYAGVPAMVVSLWQVNDASTSTIMQAFYQNLAKGMDKAEALRQAKLTYIGSVDNVAAHPAFWAAFVQLGDSQPIHIHIRRQGWGWWIGGGLAAILLVGGMLWMRRRR